MATTRDFAGLCCVCMRHQKTLTPVDSVDEDSTKVLKKLAICVPYENWHPHYKICPPCNAKLKFAYEFVQNCIQTQELRKKWLGEVEKQSPPISNTENSCEIQHFKCDHCDRSFRQKKYLSRHIATSHQKLENTAAIVEDFESSTESVFNDSCNVKDNDTKVDIDDIFVKKDSSVDEEYAALLSDEQECLKNESEEIEDENVDTDYSFKLEVEEDNEEFEEKPPAQKVKKKGSKKELQKCDFCDEVFKKRLDWIKHIRTNHTLEKPFACDQCDARYMNRYSLLIHVRKHTNEKPFICATCGKSFVSSADLNHHNKIHNKDRAYPCPACDRKFKTHSNLRTHRLQMHLDPALWQFPCNLCDKKFPMRGNLIKHLKRHAGIKEFDCHICAKKFLNRAELTLHLNTHTNQRLFKCAICRDKDYKNREGLRRHMKVVHDQGNWKAPKPTHKFLCPMCPKMFVSGNKLQRHMCTHTGEKPFKCEYCPKRFIDNYGRKVHYKMGHDIAAEEDLCDGPN